MQTEVKLPRELRGGPGRQRLPHHRRARRGRRLPARRLAGLPLRLALLLDRPPARADDRSRARASARACASTTSATRASRVEIAYWNPGVGRDSGRQPALVANATVARPVIRSDLGQIWFPDAYKGFHVLQFRDGVWPFAGTDPCPHDDYYLAAVRPRLRRLPQRSVTRPCGCRARSRAGHATT